MVGLHPDLIRIIRRAASMATAKLDFVVTEGPRSKEQCYINFGKGRTQAQCRAGQCPIHYAQPKMAKVTWLRLALGSNHLVKDDGFGYAFDAYPANPVSVEDKDRCKLVAGLMLTAAALEGLKERFRWGGDWNSNGKPGEKGETDFVHFELTPKE